MLRVLDLVVARDEGAFPNSSWTTRQDTGPGGRLRCWHERSLAHRCGRGSRGMSRGAGGTWDLPIVGLKTTTSARGFAAIVACPVRKIRTEKSGPEITRRRPQTPPESRDDARAARHWASGHTDPSAAIEQGSVSRGAGESTNACRRSLLSVGLMLSKGSSIIAAGSQDEDAVKRDLLAHPRVVLRQISSTAWRRRRVPEGGPLGICRPGRS
jgi:hypothetical protein